MLWALRPASTINGVTGRSPPDMVAAIAPHSWTSMVAISLVRTLARMRWPALDIIEALHTRDATALVKWLTRHDPTHRDYVNEAWAVAASVQTPPQDPAAFAALCRRTRVERICTHAIPHQSAHKLKDLLFGFAKQSNFSLHGDAYVALRLRLLLPAELTSSVPRYAAPYEAAAKHFGEGANEVVRPLLTTPIRDVLDQADWGPDDVAGFCAGAVTLREMLGEEPHVYVNNDCATASGVALAWLHGAAGVIDAEGFHAATTPLDALWAWARQSEKGAAIVAACNGEESPFARFAK